MSSKVLASMLMCAFSGGLAFATDPAISNVRAVQTPGSHDLEIRYDLAPVNTNNLVITVNISTNDGASWFFPSYSNLTGDVGSETVLSGSDRTIIWQGWRELPALNFPSVKVKVIASFPEEVAWYKMDDNATNRILTDASVSAHNATNDAQNTASRTTAGKLGGALYYTGTEHAASRCPAVTGALSGRTWTIAYWAKRSLTSSHASYWMMQRENGDPYGGYCYMNFSTGLRWLTGPVLGETRTSVNPFDFAAGTWVHFAFMRNGTEWKMYRNGVLMVSGSGDETGNCFAFNLGIAGHEITTNTRSLDDFRVYDAPLSADDVLSLYNGGTGTDAPLNAEDESFGISPAAAYDLSDFYLSAVGIQVTPLGETGAVKIVGDNSGDGGTSIKLGGVGLLADGALAGIEGAVTGSGVLKFDWKVSSEAGYDRLLFYEVDGSFSNVISGSGEGWQRVFVMVNGEPDAVHTFRWEYRKDPVGDYVGEDCGWVDAIALTPVFTLTVDRGTGDGSYTNGQQVAIVADAPPNGYLFDRWTGATQHVTSITSAMSTVTMPASDISVAATFCMSPTSLAAGVPVSMTGNSSGVTIVGENSGDGGSSVQLGGIGLLADGEWAGIEFAIAGAGVLAFDWKVSSETNYDWLRFYEVGTGATNQISGVGAGWTRVFITVGGAPDTVHTFRWEYLKDPVGDYVGEDCGWVDAISWAPVYALTVNHGAGSGGYTNGTLVAISADTPATHFMFDCWAGDTHGVADVYAASTILMMPATSIVVTATYKPALYSLAVINGSGAGAYTLGSTVEIVAALYEGKRFHCWTGDVEHVADVASATTTVQTADHALSVVATYSVPLTVNAGGGDGWYVEGAIATVRADPDPMYLEFAGWTGDAAGLLADAAAPLTTLTIPTAPATLTATYRASIARATGSYGRAYTTSGTSGGIATDVAAGAPSGTAAVKLGGAGVVPDNGFAAFETVVSGSGSVTFWWKVSSESNADYLKFFVDGIQIAAISGTKLPWAQISNRVEGAGVTHTLRWEYVKNGSVASSTDAGWVDDIVWTGDVPAPVIAPDIRSTAATNNVFAFTFWGERGIPYTVYSNATLDAWGWAPMDIVPQEAGETNGLFRFNSVIVPPAGQSAGFYRIFTDN